MQITDKIKNLFRREVVEAPFPPQKKMGALEINAYRNQPELKKLLNEGYSVDQISAKMEIAKSTLYRYCSILGLETKNRGERRKAMTERTLDMIEMHRAGHTYVSIGKKHGVTRERVRQIIVANIPDTQKQIIKASSLRRCNQCDNVFANRGSGHGKFCSTRCYKTFKGKEVVWNRDIMLKILAERDKGRTWKDIENNPPYSPKVKNLRLCMQRQKGILLSSDEERHYFGNIRNQKSVS